jgi:hypothetical protein
MKIKPCQYIVFNCFDNNLVSYRAGLNIKAMSSSEMLVAIFFLDDRYILFSIMHITLFLVGSFFYLLFIF